MPTLRIIGAGRAGSSLHAALAGAGWDVLPIVHHTDDLTRAATGCDLLLLAVPDHAVAATARRVVPHSSTVVAHCAGALGLDALAPHSRRASLHPMVALADAATGSEQLRGAWFAVAGDPLVQDAVAALGGRAVDVPDDARAAHHAACVIASNHLVALLATVERVSADAGVPLAAHLDLVRGALANVETSGAVAALTGPVARGDWDTVSAHLATLPEMDRPAYLALAAEAARLARRSLPPGLAVRREPLEVADTKAGFRKYLDDARAAGLSVGLVPTMGALHDGHASLVRRAALECDVVAVTIFVNPLQFDQAADLLAYPRTLDADLDVCRAAGASIVFAPTVEEMYGGGSAVTVHVSGLSDRLEGASRPGHFDGVATVVSKLFSLSGPCRAYFGEKDFQQVAVVRRLVADLDLPVEVVPCATVRDGDGLALSSRNSRLNPDERAVAPALHRALEAGAELIRTGERNPAIVRRTVEDGITAEPLFRLDRVDVVDATTLDSPTAQTTEWRILAAAYLGAARLIDNVGVTAMEERSVAERKEQT